MDTSIAADLDFRGAVLVVLCADLSFLKSSVPDEGVYSSLEDRLTHATLDSSLLFSGLEVFLEKTNWRNLKVKGSDISIVSIKKSQGNTCRQQPTLETSAGMNSRTM